MRGVFENTFENGMSSDYSVVLQPDGTTRYVKNCQLISQDGNNYVVKDCIGNTLTFTINPPYVTNFSTVGVLPKPIIFLSFPDALYVISTNNNDETGGYGEIGRIDYLPYGEGIKPVGVVGQYNAGYTPLYHSANLNLSQLYMAKGFSYIENELVRRIYWTDNFNEPRVFNVSDPIFTAYILSGDIVQGETYMVLEGVIEYPVASNNFYGPGMPLGNVFTGSIPNTTFTDKTAPTPTAKVIAYYPYELLDFNPSRELGNITFDQYGSGSLYCGAKVYYYRLISNSGTTTSWSYGSAPISVGTQNTSAYLTSSPSIPYADFVGGGTSTVLRNSGLSVFINIENIDTTQDYIEVACSEFDQSELTPRQTTIIYKGEITALTMNIEHDGSINLGDVSLADLTLFPAYILKCKTLATNKNYIIAGNITERQELDLDFSGVSASVLYYPMNVHQDADSCSLSQLEFEPPVPLTGGYSVAVPTPAKAITPFSRWLVTSGEATTNTVTYNGSLYLTNSVITGVTGAGNDQMAFAGTGAVVPCVTRNRYTNNASERVENAIELKGTNPANTCFWDYKSAAVSHHATGYWGEEVYRWAIIIFDLKGNPYYGRHLLDFTFPKSSVQGLIRADQIGNTGDYVYSINPKLISFSGITFTPETVAKMKGFSIMRAERDARIITQGLVMQCAHTGASPDVVQPSAFVPTYYDLNANVSNTYSFLSPDILCNAPLPSTVGVVGDSVEVSSWVSAYDYSAGGLAAGLGRVRGNGSNAKVIYTKFLSNTGANISNQADKKITYWGDVNESGTLNLGTSGTFSQEMNLGLGGTINGDCGSGNYNLNSHNAVGCKKSVFKLDSDFVYATTPGSGDSYTTSSNINNALENTTRILGNYVKSDFGSPYGGTGEAALANTLYISTGHYQPITSAVLADVFDGANYTFNNIEVAGGDCFINLIDIGYGLWNNNFTDKYSYMLAFPCECNSNYNLRRGRKTSNVGMYDTGASESIIMLGASSEVRLEDFEYNPGYTAQGQRVVYPALPVNFINSSQFQARLRWAGEKVIGEKNDSFRFFATNDKKDLSANYGRVNDVNVKEDKVIVWQDDAISTVPILERQLNTSVTGDLTTIGTGGVIDRWDVVTSYFGCQHQWSICETEYGFAFFDMKRKALVILSFNNGLLEASYVQGLKGVFSEAFLEIEGTGRAESPFLLNSPELDITSDRPLTGVGVISAYDEKFKMTYMTFKFYGQNSTGFKSKDFTIGYLHTDLKKCFVGFFDMFPDIMHNHNGFVIMANNSKNTTQYLLENISGKSFVVGETLWGSFTNKQKEYVCIQNVTLDAAGKYPEGINGATYWLLINSSNQLWVLNQPSSLDEATAPDYVYNKFFGLVVDNQINFVVNPKLADSFEVQNIEQNTTSSENYTDVYTEAGSQSASDLSISSTDINYRFVNNSKIETSLPLSDSGRIVNNYLLIKLVKHNWLTNPTVLTKGVKILQSVTSLFNTKK